MGGWEGGSRGKGYIQLIHVVVQQKPTQHCKAVFLQLKKINGTHLRWASQVALVVKNLPANAGDTRDMGLIAWLGRSPGGGNGNYSSILAWKITE